MTVRLPPSLGGPGGEVLGLAGAWVPVGVAHQATGALEDAPHAGDGEDPLARHRAASEAEEKVRQEAHAIELEIEEHSDTDDLTGGDEEVRV